MLLHFFCYFQRVLFFQSLLSPDNNNEFITEDGPGITEYFTFSLMHSVTNLYPGSDIRGAPASEIIDIVLPAFAFSIIFFVLLLSL